VNRRADPLRGFFSQLRAVVDSLEHVADAIDGVDLDSLNVDEILSGWQARGDDAEHRAACAVLGLDPEVEHDEQAVRAAYRRAARTAHPDAGGSPDAFARVARARDVLLGGAA
jgi:DnaJ-domain-containing protein 1